METQRKCLVVGSLNVDCLGKVCRFPKRDEAVELCGMSLAAGGHAGNCAASLARLGVSTRLAGSIGDDVFGDILVETLRKSGVDVDFLMKSHSAHTGFAFVPILTDGDKALYIARGANELLSNEVVELAARGCEAIIIFDPPRTIIPLLSLIAGTRLSVFAPGGLLVNVPTDELAVLFGRIEYLILNGPEARSLTREQSPAEAARFIAAHWNLKVIVTVGKHGCWIAGPGQITTRLRSFTVETVDATGAGDAFVGGLCAALLRGDPIMTAARYASAVAALATRKVGAQASLPDQSEVEVLFSGRAA